MTTPNTTIETLRNADWDKLHDDVSLRIGLIQQAVCQLEPNAINDKIANELLLPAIRLLADFILRIHIAQDQESPGSITFDFSALSEFTNPTESPATIQRHLDAIEYWLGISECECKSPLPSGGCLKCDLERWKETFLTMLPA
ncbi:MAG: hypothetical protein WCS43_12275, partial [Verrucomicrobiota bacterium]